MKPSAKALPKATQQTALTTSTAAPVKGLNARDAISMMDPHYALTLTNFICNPYGVTVRQGYQKHTTGIVGSTGLTSNVETLMSYDGAVSASGKLFGASDSFIYDVSVTGTTAPVAVQSGLLNAQWSSTNFAIPSGHYLVCANGADTAKLYDGTSWSSFSVVASPSAPGQVTNLTDPANWTYVLAHQQRLWFIEKNSTKCGYFDIQALGGTPHFLDFGAYFPRGGYLVAIGGWAIDSGSGMQEHFVGISSNGDVVVYIGYDPSSSATWSLAGTYQLGAPVGNRPFLKLGGDLLVITQDGLVPLSKSLQSARVNNEVAVSLAIEHLISTYVATNGAYNGWQVINYPGKNLLILNIPQADKNSNTQLVMNTITGGWSQFDGMAAQCWAVHNNTLYFGGMGAVYIGLIGYRDNADFDTTGGTNVVGTGQQAYSYFDNPGIKKKFNMVRPVFMSTSTPTITIGCNVDYNLTQVPASTSILSGLTIGVWDAAIFDVALWGGQTFTFQNWKTISATGFAASLIISISAPTEVTWVSTDWVIQKGGSV